MFAFSALNPGTIYLIVLAVSYGSQRGIFGEPFSLSTINNEARKIRKKNVREKQKVGEQILV